jgi:hypothetical protein
MKKLHCNKFVKKLISKKKKINKYVEKGEKGKIYTLKEFFF